MEEINEYFKSQHYCLLSLIDLKATYAELIQFIHSVDESRVTEKEMQNLVAIADVYERFNLKLIENKK